jgi:3-deoxy-manno-octulosonate cytidylyltransferase (CMP-KDO synthetase)
MKILAIIPARMASSRFPGKPMMKINGKPMIGHVYERVSRSKLLEKVIVATCDNVIKEYIESIGGVAILTSDKHERASDRCAEALLKIENDEEQKYNIVLMVQGDEPLIVPEMIEEALIPIIKDNDILVVNLMAKINDDIEFKDTNCIKVVTDLENNAIYFSRQPIPSQTRIMNEPNFKQVCVIPFNRDFLIKYNSLNPTPLEIRESVDMMRVIEHGYKVRMANTNYETQSVDTPDDLVKVEKIMLANI